MRTLLTAFAMILILATTGFSQGWPGVPPGECGIYKFEVTPRPGHPGWCTLHYTFKNKTTEVVRCVQVMSYQRTAVEVEAQVNATNGFASSGAPEVLPPHKIYSFVTGAPPAGLQPGGLVTVSLHVKMNMQDFLAKAQKFPASFRLWKQAASLLGNAYNAVTNTLSENVAGEWNHTLMRDDFNNKIYGPPMEGVDLSCSELPRPGGFGTLELEAPGLGTQWYFILPSFDDLPGFDIGGFHLPVNRDGLFHLSLDPTNPYMMGFQGTIDPVSERAFGFMFLPPLPELEGLNMVMTAVVLNSQQTGIASVMESPLRITVGQMSTPSGP